MPLGRGAFLRHPTKGYAVVVGTRPGKVDVLFESNERATLAQSWVEATCNPLNASDLPSHAHCGTKPAGTQDRYAPLIRVLHLARRRPRAASAIGR